MKSAVVVVSLLLVAVFAHAGKHHRKQHKRDEAQYPEDIAGGSDQAGIPGMPGMPEGQWPGGGGGGSSGCSSGPGTQYPGMIDSPGGWNQSPSGAERKSMSRGLRTSLDATRRGTKLH